MKKGIFVIIMGIIVLSIVAFAVDQQPEKVRLYVKARDTIGMKSLSDLDLRHQFAHGVVSVEMSSTAAEQLAQNPHFEVVGEATLWSLTAPPSSCSPWPACKGGSAPAQRIFFPADQTPWGIEVVYNNPALTATNGGAGVNVAVLDTGATINHLDLTRRVVQCKDFTKRKLSNGCTDENGHGTHTAGTVAADAGNDSQGIYGVAPNANLFIYKVCGTQFCWSDDVAAAINYAANQGADIISMSLGGSSLATIEKNAIDYAVANDVLVIAAAGNSGPNVDTINYPAAYEKVVAVAALDSSLSVTSWSSRGSNDGDSVIEEREVEIALPGAAVESTWNDGGYRVISGTSMATPHASGLAARHWQGSAALTRTWLQTRAALLDITAGQYAAAGDDPASGLGLPTVE
ncbi:MAG: S8 family serine peptidase [Nanoarchaeota archaeon]|nr:S8 family serine peptidase [Nanoarchaeota archaeon]